MQFFTILFIAAMLMTPARAEENPDWFYSTCNRDLAVADSFADECLKHARTQTRYFNGAPETHSYYFDPNNSPTSHFGMGCMLGATGRIMYLGLYYTTHPRNWAIANTATMRYITFQGDVGLTVNGEPVNLLAVRQFKTDKVPARYQTREEEHNLGGKDTNCELHTGTRADWLGSPQGGHVVEQNPENPLLIKWCYMDRDPKAELYCNQDRYSLLTGPNTGQIMWVGSAESEIIRDDGSYLYNTDKTNQFCAPSVYAQRLNTPTLLYELCPGESP